MIDGERGVSRVENWGVSLLRELFSRDKIISDKVFFSNSSCVSLIISLIISSNEMYAIIKHLVKYHRLLYRKVLIFHYTLSDCIIYYNINYKLFIVCYYYKLVYYFKRIVMDSVINH